MDPIERNVTIYYCSIRRLLWCFVHGWSEIIQCDAIIAAVRQTVATVPQSSALTSSFLSTSINDSGIGHKIAPCSVVRYVQAAVAVAVVSTLVCQAQVLLALLVSLDSSRSSSSSSSSDLATTDSSDGFPVMYICNWFSHVFDYCRCSWISLLYLGSN